MTPAKLQSTLRAGLAHHRAGRLDQAAAIYEQILKVAPRLFDAVHLAGTVAYQRHDYNAAVTLLSRALSLDPRSAPCAMRLGMALFSQGHPDKAEKHLRTSLARDPSAAETWNGLGLVLRALGRPPDAIEAFRRALVLQPGLAEAHDQLGALIADTQGFVHAIPHFRKAIELNPRFAGAWCNLGLAQVQSGDIPGGVESLDKALSIDPGFVQAMLGKGLALQRANQIPEAVAAYDRALALDPGNVEAGSARLLCLNYLDTIDPSRLYEEHLAFGKRLEGDPAPRRIETALPSAHEPLRVAFLSPDLRAHSVSYFLEPLLAHLDRSRFEIILYHDHAVTDAVSDRLRQRARLWRNFASHPDRWVEERIREDRPDILVDLAGHTGFNRLPVFARRPAPVQISYLGYPNTTGLSAINFRFTDEIADPFPSSDAYHTERLLRFSPCAWTYQPPSSAPEVAPPPCLDSSQITFGSFNNAAKFSDHTLRLWSDILRRVPNSCLFMKGHGVDEPSFQDRLLAYMDARNISRDRLTFAGRTSGLEAHLALYNRIDVALDTSPYNGTTTTCEALWMGRPVVTLAGNRHASRVSASLLSAVGHSEWIATSDEEYVRLAARLVQDRKNLAASTAELRTQLAASLLMDHATQAKRFGEALVQCHSAATRAAA
ncbi:MAG: tetratricopeptide repeat protein [Opitutaceae bacterium]|nr:tetratricopeptide repeat protein [Opitutaceae bacterium]